MKPYESRFPENLLRQYRELSKRLQEQYYHDPSEDDPVDDYYDFQPYIERLDLSGYPQITVEGNNVLIEQRGFSVASMTIEEIIRQRRRNLINDAHIARAETYPYERVLRTIVVECGYGFSLRGIITQMRRKGVRTFLKARNSCGARDVLDRKLLPVIPNYSRLEIPTLDFRIGEEGTEDVVSVLYIGRYAMLDLEVINRVATLIATEPGIGMEVEGIR